MAAKVQWPPAGKQTFDAHDKRPIESRDVRQLLLCLLKQKGMC